MPDQPSALNDDTPPVTGLFSTRKRAAETVFAMAVIAAGGWWAVTGLSSEHLKGVAITLAIAAVFAFLGAGWRWWRTGRA